MKPTKKQIKWIVLTILILLSLIIPIVNPILRVDNDVIQFNDGLHAYLTDQQKAENKAQIGSVDTKIVEEFEPPAKLQADIEFKKDVKIQCTGLTSAFVRTKAVFTDSDIEAFCVVDWNVYDEATNPTGWIYNEEDGYWYYPHVLERGDITSSLFTKVSIPNRDMNEDGIVDSADAEIINTLMKDFDIIIYQEAYQALCNDGSYTTDENGYFVNYQDAWAKYKTNKPAAKESGYSIAYYANHNAATGSMKTSSHIIGYESKLTANAFSVDNHMFMGWNTKKDGSGISLVDEAAISLDIEENTVLNLYAQWRKIEIAFTVDGTEYRAGNGMTWNAWFASDKYNTDIFNGKIINNADGNEVSLDALIIDGAVYTLTEIPVEAPPVEEPPVEGVIN